MDQEELISKLGQIEEQAQLTLTEFPQTLTKERQRMIIAPAKYLRSHILSSAEPAVREPAAAQSIEDITPLGRA